MTFSMSIVLSDLGSVNVRNGGDEDRLEHEQRVVLEFGSATVFIKRGDIGELIEALASFAVDAPEPVTA